MQATRDLAWKPSAPAASDPRRSVAGARARSRVDRQGLVLPALLITVGAGWLLRSLGVAPGIDWIWTLSLAIVGVLPFPLGRADKVSVVLGPFFLAASGLSVLRQTGRLALDVELPLLVVLAGVLLLVARLPSVPRPEWLAPEREGS